VTLWDALAFLALANVLSFGNGTFMLVLLQRTFVHDTAMLTNEQLLYAFALARVTPGQANLYVGSIGYMMFGLVGGVLSMLVIATPSYLMLPLMRGYERFRGNRPVRNFTRGLAATAVGLILATSWNLGKDSLVSPVTWIVLALALALMLFTRLPTVVSLLIATSVGIAIRLVGGVA
jgi:chromate transporter